jgi:2',3'-cyclic-nucleotide 2'-phosphodiesterase (5'-nucleotidase family)
VAVQTVCFFAQEHFGETRCTDRVRTLFTARAGALTVTKGNITLGYVLEILPFEDPIVVLELDGESLWEALEASLATWPAQEG